MKQFFFLSLIFAFAISCENTPKVDFNAVDLGLPSGCLWADMNLGATSIEDHGNFYFWGDVEPYVAGSKYRYVTDGAYISGGEGEYLKYTSNTGTISDNKTVLDYDDDPAAIISGGEWTIPSEDDIDELLTFCTWEEDERNGAKGITFTGPNGNTLFLPNPGSYSVILNSLMEGNGSEYWTNTQLHEVVSSLIGIDTDNYAYILAIKRNWKGTKIEKDFHSRLLLAMIRPVQHK